MVSKCWNIEIIPPQSQGSYFVFELSSSISQRSLELLSVAVVHDILIPVQSVPLLSRPRILALVHVPACEPLKVIVMLTNSGNNHVSWNGNLVTFKWQCTTSTVFTRSGTNYTVKAILITGHPSSILPFLLALNICVRLNKNTHLIRWI